MTVLSGPTVEHARGVSSTIVVIESLYDRRFWPSMQAAWADGLPARAPGHLPVLGIIEWRESARRLAKHLGCTVRTGARNGRVVAVANGGYPLGITDPYERDAWLRCRADADGGH